MPRGEHIATCAHCGRRWRVGDCIPSVCDECDQAGHRGDGFGDCPVCSAELEAFRGRIDEATRRRAAPFRLPRPFGEGIPP